MKAKMTGGTTTVERTFPSRGGKLRVAVEDVPALACPACGETLVAGDDLGRAELLAVRRALEAGAQSGALLAFARRSLGLKATDLAALLAVTAETVSRWENDRVEPEPAVWNLAADLVDDRLEGHSRTQDRLRAAAGARRPGRAALVVRFEAALGAG
jgi:YgiT-type zinc finger domain-containing protein